MAQKEQDQIRMARMLSEGQDREAVLVELGISRETFYRWKRSDSYRRILAGLGSIAVPQDHPDIIAARDAAAANQLTLAELVAEASQLGMLAIIDRLRHSAAEERLGDLVAATRFALEAQGRMVGTAAEDDERPLTAAEAEAARRLLAG
jgi:hypothetical protein